MSLTTERMSRTPFPRRLSARNHHQVNERRKDDFTAFCFIGRLRSLHFNSSMKGENILTFGVGLHRHYGSLRERTTPNQRLKMIFALKMLPGNEAQFRHGHTVADRL